MPAQTRRPIRPTHPGLAVLAGKSIDEHAAACGHATMHWPSSTFWRHTGPSRPPACRGPTKSPHDRQGFVAIEKRAAVDQQLVAVGEDCQAAEQRTTIDRRGRPAAHEQRDFVRAFTAAELRDPQRQFQRGRQVDDVGVELNRLPGQVRLPTGFIPQAAHLTISNLGLRVFGVLSAMTTLDGRGPSPPALRVDRASSGGCPCLPAIAPRKIFSEKLSSTRRHAASASPTLPGADDGPRLLRIVIMRKLHSVLVVELNCKAPVTFDSRRGIRARTWRRPLKSEQQCRLAEERGRRDVGAQAATSLGEGLEAQETAVTRKKIWKTQASPRAKRILEIFRIFRPTAPWLSEGRC